MPSVLSLTMVPVFLFLFLFFSLVNFEKNIYKEFYGVTHDWVSLPIAPNYGDFLKFNFYT